MNHSRRQLFANARRCGLALVGRARQALWACDSRRLETPPGVKCYGLGLGNPLYPFITAGAAGFLQFIRRAASRYPLLSFGKIGHHHYDAPKRHQHPKPKRRSDQTHLHEAPLTLSATGLVSNQYPGTQ